MVSNVVISLSSTQTRDRYATELSAARAGEAAAAARDAAVREVSKAHQTALSDIAIVRAHFETLSATGKPRADAALAAAVESLTAELAEARRQRSAVEADLFEAMRKLRGYSADLAAARQGRSVHSSFIHLHMRTTRQQQALRPRCTLVRSSSFRKRCGEMETVITVFKRRQLTLTNAC